MALHDLQIFMTIGMFHSNKRNPLNLHNSTKGHVVSTDRSASLKMLSKAGEIPHNIGYQRRKEEKVTRKSIEELITAWRARYHKAKHKEKTKILDEFVALIGYHRKAAIRALGRKPRSKDRRGRPRVYTNEVKAALLELWELSGKLRSESLAPFLSEFMDVLERNGELTLRPEVKKLLGQISPATIDRLPAQVSEEGGAPRSTNQPRKRIPVHTAWEGEKIPGYVELDLGLHCGESTKGAYLHTLNVADIATAWCKPVVLQNRSQTAVKDGLEKIRHRLPFSLRGIDSDNDTAFLNDLLIDYCDENDISFTRCRPYRKNDQAHIEQKNWTAVRKLIGYDRYESEEAFTLIDAIYDDWRLLMNYFQPVRKLIGKERVGAKIRKYYDRAKTPYQRVLASLDVKRETKERLQDVYLSLNPVKIRHRMEENLRKLWGSMSNLNSEAMTPI